ncbi:hypothetical protein JXR74_07290 [Candidatus Mcinerneyibacteriota bacterium]|nr:hypothetical protein [Candidatus Mcinerneyibacteriota bacterium]
MAMTHSLRITAICGAVLVSGVLLFLFFKPGGVFCRTTAAHALSYFFNMNRVKVSLAEGLDRQKVRVVWGESVVYDKGRIIRAGLSRERYRYGNNTFHVFYEAKEIARFTHYKFNNWHYHAYKFRLSRQDGGIGVSLALSGPDKKFMKLSAE